MQYVCDNPDWWMLEIVNGFSSHVNTLDTINIDHLPIIMRSTAVQLATLGKFLEIQHHSDPNSQDIFMALQFE